MISFKKKCAAVVASISAIVLSACGSPNAPAEFQKISHAQSWIEEVGYDCNEWKENSKTHALCRLDDRESITITLTDTPHENLSHYFDGPTWVGAAVGTNWFSPCLRADMDKCGALSMGDGLSYIPNPLYVD